MNIRNLINRLKDNNIDISLLGNDLEISFDGDHIPDHLINELKEHKPAIVAFLQGLSEGTELDIPVAPEADTYPLSSAQRRLWVLDQLEEGNIAYNLPDVFVFEGVLNITALEQSLFSLISRHEILRTVFREDGKGDVVQLIIPGSEIGFELFQKDLRGIDEQESTLKDIIKEHATRPFNLAKGPLLRAALYQIEEHKWVFAYAMHHIVSDGWSMEVLVRELMTMYNAFASGKEPRLKTLRIQYKDYAMWQQKQLDGEANEIHRNYWLKQFEGELPLLEMPVDKVRPAVKTFEGNRVSCRFSPALSKQMKDCCKEEGVTLFMGILAIVNILLYRYSGQSDIIIGSPAAGRDHTDLEDQIGFYINTLALRNRFSGEDSFKEILQQVRAVTMDAFEHQVYPFDELVNQLSLERDLSRNALFDVMVVLQNAKMIMPVSNHQPGALNISVYPSAKEHISQFDMKFDFVEIGADLQLTIEYNTDIYSEALMEQITRHITQLTNVLLQHKETPVNAIQYLSDPEKEKLIVSFNDTRTDFHLNKTLTGLFEEKVKIMPNKVVLQNGDTKYSFSALNNVANQLGNYLREEFDIRPDDLIAVKLDRTELMVIAILGILKAGGAYVPVDPDSPAERTAYILNDISNKVLIDEKFMVSFSAKKHLYRIDNLPQVNKPEDLAYVIYTSGSTGKPKGCMLEHKGVVNRIAWMWQQYGFNTEDVILQKTTFTFDVSVWEIFMPLCMGAGMVLCPKEAAGVPENILSLAALHQVTCMHFVPSVLNEFLRHVAEHPGNVVQMQSLKRLITSGEALLPETVNQWYQYFNAPLHNLYGPTEASVDVTYYQTAPDQLRIPIGRPVWNTAIRILDKSGNLQPIGVPGEICISGLQVARGYLNQPELTAVKFTTDPYADQERMYKTGDLGRWLSDGNIEYLGRIDQQVKIRGFRIETGEIEVALESHPDIKSAVVIAADDHQHEKQLIAYIITEKELAMETLQHFLAQKLPYYMLPAHYVKLDKFPLTASGKTDRKKLPAQQGIKQVATHTYIDPSGETALKLAAIWKDILGTDQIGITDNFFMLGGHSLKANRLASRIYKTFNVKIALKDLFLAPIFEQQLRLIEQPGSGAFSAIVRTNEQGYYPLSSSQRRLYILSQFEDANIAYNMPGVYIFEGALNQQVFNDTFCVLIARHESLRTVFRNNDQGIISQVILPEAAFTNVVSFHDLRNNDNAAGLAEKHVQAEFATAFNLSEGPLFSFSLQRIQSGKWIFSYVLHHIIADGISVEILMQEMMQVYNALVDNQKHGLASLNIQFKDYAVWQKSDYSAEKDRVYWKKHFEGELPVLELLGDKIRPANRTYNGAIAAKKINNLTAAQLMQLINSENSTTFMGLMAIVNMLLYRYTGQEDIIIGTPVSGREHPDLEQQIGFYANTLAIRTKFSGTYNYGKLLAETRKIVLDSFAHQSYPFDELVDELGIRHDAARNPLFDVQVIVQEIDRNANHIGMKGININRYGKSEKTTSVFDLVFKFTVFGEEIELSIEYNNDLYSPAFIEQLMHHIEEVMGAVVQTPLAPINKLNILSPKEKETLLVTFAGPNLSYDQDCTVLDLFYTQVDQHPDDIAIKFEETQLSYRKLDEQSNRLAHYLKANYNIQPDDLVGIMTDSSDKMIVGILGILKAGAAYVPIDPEYPRSRKEYILRDTAVKVLITQTDYLFDIDYHNGALFAIDVQMDGIDASLERPLLQPSPSDLAYVIYTSGSTGAPKGVLVTHGNLMHFLVPRKRIYKHINSFLLLSSFAFDASVPGIFGTLCDGGTLCITRKIDVDNVDRVVDLLLNYKVSHLLAVPSYYALLINALQDRENALEQVIVAGENCPLQLVQKHFEMPVLQHCDFFNEYGPTECTVGATIHQYEKDNILSSCIGKPMANTTVYILDAADNLVPIGVAGEICISGNGVARGYLHQEELTAKKFVPTPFDTTRIMYRTGDIGKRNADGTIEFLGRKDDQVKIRGYRIELGEIENALLTHVDIKAAVVVVRIDKLGSKELVAYIVSDATPDMTELRSYLMNMLQVYMIPALFVAMEELPLTVNGKVDRKNLPDPEGKASLSNILYVKPRTATEQQLVRIWEEMLGKEKIGIYDDYFELGGNSLKAMLILKRILDETGVVISIKTLFLEKNIAHMALYIDAAGMPIISPELPAGNGSQLIEMSYAQQIYCSDWKSGNEIVITPVPLAELDLAAFETAFRQLIERHEILRTIFVKQNGKVYQQVLPLSETGFYIPEPIIVNSDEELDELIAAEKHKPLDLFDVPLLHIQLYQLQDLSYLMLMRMHHAITDGYSDGIFYQELTELYQATLTGAAPKMEELRFQYRDFTAWQHHFVQSEQGVAHQQYWKQKLQTFRPKKTRIAKNNIEDANSAYCFNKVIAGNEFEKVNRFVIDHRLTRATLLISTMFLTLFKQDSEEDHALFMTVSGRNSHHYGGMDVSGLIGNFVNAILIRNTINPEYTLEEFLQSTQEGYLDDLNYDSYPFEKLIHELPLINPSSISDSLVFINYHNYDYLNKTSHEVPVSETEGWASNKEAIGMSFGLVISEYQNSLKLQLVFNPLRFRKLEAAMTVDLFYTTLSEILSNPHQVLRSLQNRISRPSDVTAL